MTCWDDETVAEVLRLYEDGYSVRAIARTVGISRRQVENILAEAIEVEDELDDDERTVVLDAEDDHEPVPPFVFVGIEVGVYPMEDDWRYLDATGHPTSELDIYRHKLALWASDRYDEADAIEADLDRQYAATPGLRRVDLGGNLHVWQRDGLRLDAK